MCKEVDIRLNKLIDTFHERDRFLTTSITQLTEITKTLIEKVDKLIDTVQNHHERIQLLEQFESKIGDLKEKFENCSKRLLFLESTETKRTTIKTFFIDILKNWRYLTGISVVIGALWELTKFMPH